MKEISIDLQRMEPLLEKLFLFKSLGAEMKEKFLAQAVVVIAGKDETIIREGDTEATVYILVEGEVEVKTQKDGADLFLSLLKPNAIIGEISAMTRKPRTATVVAATPCSLIRIEYDLIKEITDKYPSARMLLETIRQGRERDTEEKLSEE